MDRQLTYMVVDDDPKAIDLMVTYGERLPQLQLTTTETHGMRALQYINQHPVDLLLLDVDMPGMTGIEVAQALYPAPMIILVTGHDRFAVQGFEIQAVDFLIKPPSFERFAKAIHKACRLAGFSALSRTTDSGSGSPDYTYVLVHDDESYYKRIHLDQICYIESIRNEIRLVMQVGEPVVVRKKLSDFLSDLPEDLFIQVHRSFIVNLLWIDSVSKSVSWIGSHGKKIPVGGKYRSDFIMAWKGGGV